MAPSKEIERKFWVRQLPPFILTLPPVAIKQGYLVLNGNGREVRLRQKKDSYWLTVKTDGTLERSEYETPLTRQQFETLWPAVKKPVIYKTRYLLNHKDHLIEVDVYEQPLKGLVVAEIEFSDQEKAKRYQPEPWMDIDITHLNFMKNKNLLQFQSFDEVKERLFK